MRNYISTLSIGRRSMLAVVILLGLIAAAGAITWQAGAQGKTDGGAAVSKTADSQVSDDDPAKILPEVVTDTEVQLVEPAPAYYAPGGRVEGNGPPPAGSNPFVSEVEPNGTAGTATAIGGTQAWVRGTVYPANDVDFYSFSATAGSRVFAAAQTLFDASASGDSVLDVLASDGTTVLESDNNDGSFNASSSSIAGTVIPSNGTYYLRVRHNTATGTVRPYDLHFRLQTGAPTAEAESNNTTGTANPVPGSGFISGTVTAVSPGEADFFSLSLNAGDTVFLSMDMNPERDANVWNGRLGFGLFGNPPANQILVVNDANAGGTSTDPNSEAYFFTVKDTGTYFVYVDSTTATGLGANATYNLSISVAPRPASCTTYTSTNVPQAIPTGPGMVTSTLTVPGNPRIADLNVSINLNHTFMQDLDVHLQSPAGNDNGLFTDIGAATVGGPQTLMDVILDDEAGLPPGFALSSSWIMQPESAYRLHWFDGEDAGGTWTLVIRDDATGDGGTLNSWGITICEEPAAPACPMGFSPVTVYTSDFEANDGGFTHSGTQDEWERGLPTFIPITTCASGANCWKTDLDNTYNASSNQDLLSPNINLAGLTPPVLVQWSQRYHVESANFDHYFVEAREVGGANPVRLFEFLDATMNNTVGNPSVTIAESSGWSRMTRRVDSLAGTNAELRFHVDSDSTVQLAGVAIDDVTVTACQVAATPTPTATPTASPTATPVSCLPMVSTHTNNTPVAISSTGTPTVTSTINVAGAGTFLTDVNMTTFIQHTFSSDLDVTIMSPAGTIVTLTSDNGGVFDNVFDGTIWNDDANPAGQVPYASNNGVVTDHVFTDLTLASPLVPEEALGAFLGENPNGTWTITITDDANLDGGSLNSWSLELSTLAAPPVVDSHPTYTNNTPVAISDIGTPTVSSTLLVSGAGRSIHDIDLTTFIAHTFNGDLDITLMSPAGTIVTITTDNGGVNDNVFNGTVWNDDADPGNQAPFSGSTFAASNLVTDTTYTNLTVKPALVPEEAMAAFYGEDPNGTWTLTISDDTNLDGGSLNSWSLDIDTINCAPPNTADLAITKTDNRTNITPGDTTTYTIVVTNSGPLPAVDAIVTDIFPPGVVVTNWTCLPQNGALCTLAGAGNINDTVYIPMGGILTYTAHAQTATGQTGALVNTATVMAPATVTDPNPSNNSATDTNNYVVSISGNVQQFVSGGPNTPLAGVTMTLSGSNAGTTTTDAMGNYTFENLTSGGTWTVTPSMTGKVFDPVSRTVTGATANVGGINFVAFDSNNIGRNIHILSPHAVPGSPVAVPIRMNSLGTENEVSFSIDYELERVHSPTVACGASAPNCTVTTNLSTLGKLGVTIKLPPLSVFGAGLREVAVITFQSNFGFAPPNTPLTFSDTPVARSVRDAQGNLLQATWTNGFIVFVDGVESDVAPRNQGDGNVLAPDVTQVRRFVAGLDTINPMFNEFQRADAAPVFTFGDGALLPGDVVQARRYSSRLDNLQPAGGPTGPGSAPLSCASYSAITSTGMIVPGTNDIGNHCDDCATTVALPFPVTTAYDATAYTSVSISSNGTVNLTGNASNFGPQCPLPDNSFGRAIFAFQHDLRTDTPGSGIFTSISGVAPNRVFNIEWRTTYFGNASANANFQVRLFENSTNIDVIYGASTDSGLGASSGVQSSATGPATEFSCQTATLTNGLRVSYTCGNSPAPPPAEAADAGHRAIRVGKVAADPGSTVTVPVELVPNGDESAVSFTLGFDPERLTNPRVTMVDGAPSDAVLTLNEQEVKQGRLGVLIDSMSPLAKDSAAIRLITVVFDIAPGAKAGDARIELMDALAPRGLSNPLGVSLPSSFEDGAVVISGPIEPKLEIKDKSKGDIDPGPVGSFIKTGGIGIFDIYLRR